MAGIAGTLGMLAEASGCGAVLDVPAVPRPAGVSTGDWLTCFPGFAMLTADEPGAAALPAGPAVGVECGDLVPGRGVALRWPDGELTEAVGDGVTGLGQAWWASRGWRASPPRSAATSTSTSTGSPPSSARPAGPAPITSTSQEVGVFIGKGADCRQRPLRDHRANDNPERATCPPFSRSC